ncbi:MAG: LuxR C-terminal-related transcriptional regulator [Galactobacter sp.]|uniref:LuxR family transcriptional regulator n=1 Tax=Galactobacter sp. TaxID=2676125 RepID=UPI0025BA3C8D|nr:LuxR family transcriptional regulator [Galactobacter sp.]
MQGGAIILDEAREYAEPSASTSAKPERIDRILDSVQAAFDSGDSALFIKLLERNFLECWFGIQPADLTRMLRVAFQDGARGTGKAESLYSFLGAAEGELPPGAPTLEDVPPDVQTGIASVSDLFKLRLSGRIREAMEVFDHAQDGLMAINPLFSSDGGWELVLLLQGGVTAMLDGDFARAVQLFTTVQSKPFQPLLGFIVRDAYVKMALVHAAFGDQSAARTALAQSQRVPRGRSWANEQIDAHETLTRALLEVDNPDHALELLDSILPFQVGEMWPFHVHATARVLARAGRQSEVAQRLATMDALPLPRVLGEGFCGSIMNVARAADKVPHDPDSALFLLDQADAREPEVQTIRLRALLAAGRPAEALKMAELLRRNPRAAGLRQFKFWGMAGEAEAYLALDHRESAVEVLRSLQAFSGGLTSQERSYFSAQLHAFAQAEFPDWEVGVLGLPAQSFNGVTGPHGLTASIRLTRRERQILMLLDQEKTRRQIAEELFVSENTLKTHLRAIYKKLDVPDRATAVIRARREGYV